MDTNLEATIAIISVALRRAEIPYVLWGHSLLSIHGVPTILGSVDFVVPDLQLEAASEVLQALGAFLECDEVETCIAGPNDRVTPPAAFHMHISDSEVTVGLYTQSETLWFLPQLRNTPLQSHDKLDDRYFVLASDDTILPPARPGRGCGALKDLAESSVMVPRSAVLLEALMRIYARDFGKRVGGFACQMILYVEEYVDRDGYLDESEMPDALRAAYQEFKAGEKPLRQWVTDLRKTLGGEFDEDDDF